MSVWIRALCTRTVADVSPADLVGGICERLPTLGPLYGEDDVEETARLLRVDGDAPMGAWGLFYRGNGHTINIERWSDPEQVKEEVGELLETLEDSDEDGVEDVREVLGRVVETVAFELKTSDCEGIGWPVAIAAAACIAAAGEGIIQADGEGWMAPEGRGVEHVLDGD
ncbi:Hypothetical protein A7982_06871 [Minicystis rosea]|nr:Hypothetical protein A7982_06871 [Minicystis rosea]